MACAGEVAAPHALPERRADRFISWSKYLVGFGQQLRPGPTASVTRPSATGSQRVTIWPSGWSGGADFEVCGPDSEWPHRARRSSRYGRLNPRDALGVHASGSRRRADLVEDDYLIALPS